METPNRSYEDPSIWDFDVPKIYDFANTPGAGTDTWFDKRKDTPYKKRTDLDSESEEDNTSVDMSPDLDLRIENFNDECVFSPIDTKNSKQDQSPIPEIFRKTPLKSAFYDKNGINLLNSPHSANSSSNKSGKKSIKFSQNIDIIANSPLATPNKPDSDSDSSSVGTLLEPQLSSFSVPVINNYQENIDIHSLTTNNELGNLAHLEKSIAQTHTTYNNPTQISVQPPTSNNKFASPLNRLRKRLRIERHSLTPFSRAKKSPLLKKKVLFRTSSPIDPLKPNIVNNIHSTSKWEIKDTPKKNVLKSAMKKTGTYSQDLSPINKPNFEFGTTTHNLSTYDTYETGNLVLKNDLPISPENSNTFDTSNLNINFSVKKSCLKSNRKLKSSKKVGFSSKSELLDSQNILKTPSTVEREAFNDFLEFDSLSSSLPSPKPIKNSFVQQLVTSKSQQFQEAIIPTTQIHNPTLKRNIDTIDNITNSSTDINDNNQ
ncbi:hypothetical protein AYI70_g7203, partial [Smittium culicis]